MAALEPAEVADESFWLARRRDVMLDPAVVQLNAGTCSPTPQALFDRVTDLRRQQAESPTAFQWRQAWPLLHASRAALAEYVGACTQDLALVENVTVALNIAIRSIPLSPGDEVVTTDHEYGSMLKLWRRVADAAGATVKVAELPRQVEEPEQIVDAVARALNPKARVLFFSHISSPSGLVLPAEALCRLARQRGLVSVIDGAHAPGQIPLNLDALDADYYGANCHKWMMAPASVGFLHVGRHWKRRTQSVIGSWGHGYPADQTDTDVFPGTTAWHYDLEFHGTSDRTPQMVLPEAVSFRRSLGGDAAVRTRVRGLTGYLRKRLSELDLSAWLPHDDRLVGTLTAFDLPAVYQTGAAGFIASPGDSPAQRLQRALWERHRIEAPATFCAGRAFLRVSTGWFNTTDDIDRLCEALRTELPRAGGG